MKTTACISRNDIERLADPIIGQYKHTFVPARHLCYTVDPAQLAALLGYQIEYVRITKDGSILGQTSSGNIWTTIYDANMNEVLFLLDGRTILIEERLLATPRIIGRKNFTIAHKLAHQIINRQFPKMYGPQNRTFCDYRRSSKPVTDWYEWQADALAAALLLPPDAVRDGLFICGLGEKMHLMPPAPNSVGRVKTDIIKPQKARLCDWIDHTVS
ncbi:MAG: ImmA/IrrE family metallo-endopeptidase [Oscillospiraceae bacterium]|nr:ImmA/IrrE family metallo-endopeptidase [Oscillospiraceae bacterium]